MRSSTLKSLTIEHLRGSVQPFVFPFEKGKKLTFVYGENGTGKSTICDAFDFLSKGKVGSLDNRGLGKTNRYWQTIGKKPSDVSVSIETAAGICRGIIGKSEVVVTPPEQRPLIEVLRRIQIQSLVEAKPAERYTAISRFVDVSRAEASEASLRELIRNIESSRGVALARVQENLDAIQQFWEEAGKPGTAPLAWAAVEAKRDSTIFDNEIKAIGTIQAAYARLKEYLDRIVKFQNQLQTAIAAQGKAEEKLQTTISKVTGDAAEVVSVLQAAKSYLCKHPSPAVCPLCESSENVSGLSERISARLLSFSDLQTAQTAQKTKHREMQIVSGQIESIQKEALVVAAEFDRCRESCSWPADIALPAKLVPEDFNQWEEWFADTQLLSGPVETV